MSERASEQCGRRSCPEPRGSTLMSDPRAGSRPNPETSSTSPTSSPPTSPTTPIPPTRASSVAFGTSGHRGSSLDGVVQRGPHPGHDPGHLRVPPRPGHRRAAVPRPRHPRPVRAGVGHRARGARRQRRHGARRQRRPLHPDAGRVARHPAAPTAAARPAGLADGIVVTPSHNPPSDGGFKYNPPHGGPADTDATGWIARRANELLAAGLSGVRRVPVDAGPAPPPTPYEFLATYVDDLPTVVDLDAIRAAGVRIGADPLGGASVDYWGAIAERHRLDLTVVNPLVDPTWRFMTLDWDGKIRMDCSSADAMASLIGRAGRVPDRHRQRRRRRPPRHRHARRRADEPQPLPGRRHRLPVRLSRRLVADGRDRQDARVVVDDRPGRRRRSAAGSTRCRSGSSGSSPACSTARSGFGGEESAGASFLRRDGIGVDDRQGRHPAGPAGVGDPGHDRPVAVGALRRADRAPRRPGLRPGRRPGLAARRRPGSAQLSPEDVTATELAGEPITAKLTAAPGNGAAIGGLKVVTESAWFAARPSGTEDVYKIYAESFRGPEHLGRGPGRGPRGRQPRRSLNTPFTSAQRGRNGTLSTVSPMDRRHAAGAAAGLVPPRDPDATAPTSRVLPGALRRRGGVGAVPGSRPLAARGRPG